MVRKILNLLHKKYKLGGVRTWSNAKECKFNLSKHILLRPYLHVISGKTVAVTVLISGWHSSKEYSKTVLGKLLYEFWGLNLFRTQEYLTLHWHWLKIDSFWIIINLYMVHFQLKSNVWWKIDKMKKIYISPIFRYIACLLPFL